jgi:hypothetical protein
LCLIYFDYCQNFKKWSLSSIQTTKVAKLNAKTGIENFRMITKFAHNLVCVFDRGTLECQRLPVQIEQKSFKHNRVQCSTRKLQQKGKFCNIFSIRIAIYCRQSTIILFLGKKKHYKYKNEYHRNKSKLVKKKSLKVSSAILSSSMDSTSVYKS